MQASQGHSRKESDDLSKLFFGNANENFEVGGENFTMDPSLQPSLSFHQPKSSFTFSSLFAFFRRILILAFKAYVHPVGALVSLLVAIVVPFVLGWIVIHNDYKERGEWLVIDKSLQSFQIPGHISSQHEDMVTLAKKPSKEIKRIPLRTSRRKRSTPDIFPTKKTPHFQKYPKWTLELVYLARGDDDLNIFTKERIETIYQIEQKLIQQDRFPDFCWKWSEASKDPYLVKYNGCTPPISLIDFFYPSVTPEGRINDGQGMGYGGPNGGKKNLTDESINQSLDLLLTKPFTYWFVDSSFSSQNRKSRFLRAEVKFGSPLKFKYGRSRAAQFKAFKAFLVKYAEAVGKMSTDKVRVLYGGNQIFDDEVDKTLWADIRLSIFTMAFVGAFVLLFTRFSIFLTTVGIISILSPICLAYYLFRIVFKVKSLGILSGISLFIIIGIGVDDVFVFINTFRQAHNAKSLESRMAHTLSTAGKATFFTSFTTTAAFAANCVSKMPAIYEFGLFMALIVFSCWITVFATIPPALNLWHRYISKYEELVFQHLFGWMKCSGGSGNSSLPDDIVQFLSGNNLNDSSSQSPSALLEEFELSPRAAVHDDDDDSLLVQLNSSPPNSQSPSPSSSDNDLSTYDDPNSTFDLQTAPLMRRTSSRPRARTHLQDQQNKACSCGGGLQGLLYHWLGAPIKMYPLVIVVGFLLVLGASIGLDTQIQPSAKPPEFFKDSTNLQQLLNLKYNMSGDNLNVNNLALDLMDNEIKQTNNADNPTTKPKTKPTETNGIRSSTRSPVTAEQPGRRPKTSIQLRHSASTKSSTPAVTPEPTTLPRRSRSTTPPTTAKYISPTKRTLKPVVTQNKRATAKPNTQRTVPLGQQHKTGDSGNVDKPTVFPDDKTTHTLPPLCPGGCAPINKPIVDTSATVYVVFGLKSIDRSKIIRESVITKKGDVIPDYEFTDLLLNQWTKFLMYACRLCKNLNNSNLVQPGGADCFPSWIMDYIHLPQYRHGSWNKDCLELKLPSYLSGKSRAKMYKMPSKDRRHGNNTYWMMMAFESTVFMGKSSQERAEDFENWNKFLKEELMMYPKGFQTGFQTSSEWVYTFTEVVAINSAIYGIAFSLVLCLGSVAVFTANFFLTLIVMITILGVLSSVVAIFYLASWQLGAVEAISLSILVGTSVDYCVHLVEGYIMAGNAIPNRLQNPKEIRGWRSLAAVSHIGTAIFSSAITTVVASIPLCLTTIQLFAKFGQILAINTAVSIFYTLSICVALLCMMGPVRFRASIKSSLIALSVVAVVYFLGAGILFLINWKAVTIPGPAGEPLFPQL